MADYGHRMTECELSKLEREIEKVYGNAKKDLDKTLKAYSGKEYFKRFKCMDEENKKKVAEGKMTKEEYNNWRLNVLGLGQDTRYEEVREQYEAMQDEVAEQMTDTNIKARALVMAVALGIYVLNRNYSAYTIERQEVQGKGGTAISFTLFDENMVRRLFRKYPDLMPYYSPAKALERGIDLKYGKKQISKIVTSDILQGKSIPKIADDLQTRIVDMNRNSAIRAARTAVTSAENSGRMDTYKDAEKKGMEIEVEWLATLDGRTRHSHRMVDGERIKLGQRFSNGLRFPGDTSGRPEELYNCRCRLIGVPKGISLDDSPRHSRLGDMTYEEWKHKKERGKRDGK